MWIYDNDHPEGRELPADTARTLSGPVKVRFLTAKERKERGWEHLSAPRKRCSRCGEIRADYHFFRSKKTKDGLSASCRRCLLAELKENDELNLD